MQKIYLFVVPGDGDVLVGMPDIELLNMLQINCNTKGTKERRRVQITTRTKGTPSMLKVSSAMQTQAQKRIVMRRIIVQIPAYTQAAV